MLPRMVASIPLDHVPVQVGQLAAGAAGTAQTIDLMARLALGDWGTAHQVVRAQAVAIVAGLPANDRPGEAAAVLAWIRDQVRYVGDPVGVERVQSPHHTLTQARAGDCDDLSTLAAALLGAIGHRTRFVTGGMSPGAWRHVWVEVDVGGWVALDACAAKPLGWFAAFPIITRWPVNEVDGFDPATALRQRLPREAPMSYFPAASHPLEGFGFSRPVFQSVFAAARPQVAPPLPPAKPIGCTCPVVAPPMPAAATSLDVPRPVAVMPMPSPVRPSPGGRLGFRGGFFRSLRGFDEDEDLLSDDPVVYVPPRGANSLGGFSQVANSTAAGILVDGWRRWRDVRFPTYFEGLGALPANELGVFLQPGLGTAYPELKAILGKLYRDKVSKLPWLPANWLTEVEALQTANPTALIRLDSVLMANGTVRTSSNAGGPIPLWLSSVPDRTKAWQMLFDATNEAIVAYARNEQMKGKAQLDQLYAKAEFWDTAYRVALATATFGVSEIQRKWEQAKAKAAEYKIQRDRTLAAIREAEAAGQTARAKQLREALATADAKVRDAMGVLKPFLAADAGLGFIPQAIAALGGPVVIAALAALVAAIAWALSSLTPLIGAVTEAFGGLPIGLIAGGGVVLFLLMNKKKPARAG